MAKHRDNGKQDKREGKDEAKQQKWILKTDLANAKSRKRKWLFMILAAGIILYLLISSGGLSGVGDLFEKLKGLMPGGD